MANTPPSDLQIQAAYDLASERYAELGVDTARALRTAGRDIYQPALLARG